MTLVKLNIQNHIAVNKNLHFVGLPYVCSFMFKRGPKGLRWSVGNTGPVHDDKIREKSQFNAGADLDRVHML